MLKYEGECADDGYEYWEDGGHIWTTDTDVRIAAAVGMAGSGEC